MGTERCHPYVERSHDRRLSGGFHGDGLLKRKLPARQRVLP
jgi:hypothetical protein